MSISLTPLAYVKNSRKSAIDDQWGEIISEIELANHIPTEAFVKINQFSHLEIIYYFDQVKFEDIIFSGKPRGNQAYPELGIFAQRKKDRPNQLGLCTVELIQHDDRILTVKYLDAIDGTPILDIKPVYREFEPKSEISQPNWVSELMSEYW